MSETEKGVEDRLKAIEEVIWPNGPGGPTVFDEIKRRLDDMEERQNQQDRKFVTQDQYDDDRRRIMNIIEQLQGRGGLGIGA